MNTKILILALSASAIAAGQALSEFAEQLPDDIDGVLLEGATTVAGGVNPADIANAELDKEGLPWDDRIHAGTKTKTQKEVWTRKKGVADNVFDAVVAELRQHYPAATAAPAAAGGISVPGATTTPVVNVPVVATTNYAKLVDWIAKNTGEGKIFNAAWIEAAFAQNKTTLAALANDEETSAAFLDAFRTAYKGSGGVEA